MKNVLGWRETNNAIKQQSTTKKIITATSLAIALGLSSCSDSNTPSSDTENLERSLVLHPAEAIPASETIQRLGTATPMIIGEWMKKSLCNYTRVNIDGNTYSATAKHCLVHTDVSDESIEKWGDIVITGTSLSHTFRNFFWGKWKVASLNGFTLPKEFNVSRLNPSELDWKTIEIHGYYPSVKLKGSTTTGWIFRGIVRKYEWLLIMSIKSEDYNKVMKTNSSYFKKWLSGLSGSPAFIEDNGTYAYVGATSLQITTNSTLSDKMESLTHGKATQEVNYIAITPARDDNGNIKITQYPTEKSIEETPKKETRRFRVDTNGMIIPRDVPSNTLVQRLDLKDGDVATPGEEGMIITNSKDKSVRVIPYPKQ